MPAGDIQGNLTLSQVIFKSSLRTHLPMLQPLLRKGIQDAFRAEIPEKKSIDGHLITPHSSCLSGSIADPEDKMDKSAFTLYYL